MLERLARTMYRRRRRVLVAWIVALIGTFMLSGAIGGAFHTEFKLPGTESQAAFDLLQSSSFRDRQVQGQLVFKSDRGVDDPAVQRAMEGLFDEIQQKIPNVTVVSPYS
jgi:putative drug exporter of the RND superfamily